MFIYLIIYIYKYLTTNCAIQSLPALKFGITASYDIYNRLQPMEKDISAFLFTDEDTVNLELGMPG